MSNGMVASVSNYGGVVTELLVPDRIGNLKDVVLGYETLEGSNGGDRRENPTGSERN